MQPTLPLRTTVILLATKGLAENQLQLAHVAYFGVTWRDGCTFSSRQFSRCMPQVSGRHKISLSGRPGCTTSLCCICGMSPACITRMPVAHRVVLTMGSGSLETVEGATEPALLACCSSLSVPCTIKAQSSGMVWAGSLMDLRLAHENCALCSN